MPPTDKTDCGAIIDLREENARDARPTANLLFPLLQAFR
jgi:hypothetical protein